jgi:hypothetical protein
LFKRLFQTPVGQKIPFGQTELKQRLEQKYHCRVFKIMTGRLFELVISRRADDSVDRKYDDYAQ